MRKYWKSIFLFAFIIVTVGIFYIKASTVSDNFPQMKFQKVEGDEKVVDNLMVNGDLYMGMFNIESFRVDSQGTTYLRDESFPKRLEGYYKDLHIDHLQQEYRNFMRGKATDPDYFYEDENQLAYGSTPYDIWSFDNYTFEIAVLDKQTNDTVSFSLPIPNRGDYWHVEPYSVFLEGNNISIVTLNDIMNNEMLETASAHIYTFDIEKEQLVDEEVIGTLEYSNTGDGYSEISIIQDGKTFIIAESILTPIEYDEELGYYEEAGTLNKLIKYSMDTQEVKEIAVLENEELAIPFAVNGNQLHFANVQGKQLTLTNYDIEKQEISRELEVTEIDSYMSVADIFQAKVEEGK